MKVLLGISFCIFSMSAFAQQSSQLSLMAANKFYAEGDFYSAEKFYEQSLDSTNISKNKLSPYMLPSLHSGSAKKNNPTDVEYKLAMSYYQLHDYSKAEKWFEKCKDNYPYALFYYAVCLRANKKYEESSKEFNDFLFITPIDNYYTRQAKNELKNLVFINDQLSKTSLYTSQSINDKNGIEGSNYALSVVDKQIAITSTRMDSALLLSNQNPYLNQLYTVNIKDSSIEVIGKLPITSENNMHQGAVSFSSDGQRIFFTRWLNKNNDTVAAIYVAERKGDSWTSSVKLNNNVNIDGYKSIQPFITADNKYLIFSSDKPGGIGKFDLWYAPLDSNYQPGTAINMGDNINTNGNEQTPFYHSASKTLIYASDGRIGMGGFDLYMSNGNFTKWDTAINLGYPVNSNKDDLYFSCSNTDSSLWTNAYLSSDRSSDCCLQLFSITKLNPPPVINNSIDTPAIAAAPTQNTVVPDKNISLPAIIYFDFNNAELSEVANNILDSLSTLLHNNPSLLLQISGYTDGVGSIHYNLDLAGFRADACKNYLLKKGIDKKQLIIHSYGKCCPIAPEKFPSGKDDPDGRQKNRRAELKLYKPL